MNILDNVEGISRKIVGGNPGKGGLTESEIELCEVKKPQGGEAEQTWVVIHGYDASPEGENIEPLIKEIVEKAGENDRVIALDWREAAGVTGGTIGFGGGNGVAATWIGPTAQATVEALEEKFGIDSTNAQEKLNLVGHSLGSLVSSEIGQIYRTGTNRGGERITAPNKLGVRTITALDPAAETNLRPDIVFGEESGYDVDGRVEGRQTPADFAENSAFSRAYIGRKSFFGNPLFADSADETYELDFGNLVDPILSKNREHNRVVKTFTNLIDRPGKIGELLGYDSYQSLDTLPIEEFGDTDVTRRLRSRTYQGIIDIDSENRPTLLTAYSQASSNDLIKIGDYLPDTIDGYIGNDKLFGEDLNDTLSGKSGNDILVGSVGNDRLSGDDLGNSFGDDILYGGTGTDWLTGNGGSDTFVFKTGDGSSDRSQANLITDFEINVDRIGLIDINSDDLTFEGDSVDSAIKLGGEYLAVVEGVSLNEINNASQELTFYSNLDEADFEIV